MLVVDLRCLDQPLTGVQRYASEVVRRLDIPHRVARPAGGWPGTLWEQIRLPLTLDARDLLWCPANAAPLRVKRQVVTIHDTAALDHPEWFTRRFATWYRFLIPRLVHQARRIITVSEFSRQRLLHWAGLPADSQRVVAIANGVDPRFRPHAKAETQDLRERLGIRGPYILSVGSLEPRKNLKGLFAAWESARAHLSGYDLLVVGATGRNFRNRGFDTIPGGVRLLDRLPDEDLPALYAGCAAFVYPSLYEGFGLPPLEALACGVPVVAGRHTALIEHLDGLADLVAVDDTLAMATALRKAVERGGEAIPQARLGQWSWDRTAVHTRQVLRQAMEQAGD